LRRCLVLRPVRRRLGVRRLSLGLWLSRRSASELLASPDARTQLREALEANGSSS